MVGNFRGYNEKFRKYVDMRIDADGRMTAKADGADLRGYVNDRRLYVGDSEFELQRYGDGFETVQVGDYSNRVRYTRR
jgi:hypothetical protein